MTVQTMRSSIRTEIGRFRWRFFLSSRPIIGPKRALRPKFISYRLPFLSAYIATLFITGTASAECASLQVDKVWSGSAVLFAVLNTPEFVYIGYFNAERNLTVAQVNSSNCAIKIKVLDDIYRGWDAHNYIALSIDSTGYLHVSGDMHDLPMVYYRSSQKNDVTTLKRYPYVANPRTEYSVTYPVFLGENTFPQSLIRAPNVSFIDDQLSLLYRDGRSGDGIWYANVWNGNQWHQINTALYSNIESRTRPAHTVSAYPTSYVLDGKQFYNVAVVWRQEGNVNTNYMVSFARTQDFHYWYSAGSTTPIAGPLTPSPEFAVITTGLNGGLVNNAQLAIDTFDRPLISYTRYEGVGTHGTPGSFNNDTNAPNAIYVARFESGKWVEHRIAVSSARFPVEGGGALQLPSSRLHALSNGWVQISASFPLPTTPTSFDRQTYFLDPVNLAPQTSPPPTPFTKEPSPQKPPGYPETSPLTRNIATVSAPPPQQGGLFAVVQWANSGFNNDRPKPGCPVQPNPAQSGTLCNPPPTPLIVNILSPRSD